MNVDNPFEAPSAAIASDESEGVPTRSLGDAIGHGVRVAFKWATLTFFPLIALSGVVQLVQVFLMLRNPSAAPVNEPLVAPLGRVFMYVLVLGVLASILTALLGVLAGILGFVVARRRSKQAAQSNVGS